MVYSTPRQAKTCAETCTNSLHRHGDMNPSVGSPELANVAPLHISSYGLSRLSPVREKLGFGINFNLLLPIHLVRKYAGRPARSATINDIQSKKKSNRRKGSLRGRFLNKIFSESKDQEAIKAISPVCKYNTDTVKKGCTLCTETVSLLSETRKLSQGIFWRTERRRIRSMTTTREAYQQLRKDRQAYFRKEYFGF